MKLSAGRRRSFVYDGTIGQIRDDFVELFNAEIDVHDLTAFEAHREFDLIAFTEELTRVLELGFKIPFIGSISDAKLFKDIFGSLLLSFCFFFLLTVFEFTVVHDFTNWRFRFRSDFNEIKIQAFRLRERIAKLQNTKLFSAIDNDSHFTSGYSIIYFVCFFGLEIAGRPATKRGAGFKGGIQKGSPVAPFI